MSFRSIAAAVTLAGLAQLAMAATPAVEEAYEVRVSDLTLPTNDFGSVILRQCAQCDFVTLRVDGGTQYLFQGRSLPLKEFRAAVLNSKGKEKAAATVVYRLENERVRLIEVSAPPETNGGPRIGNRG